MARIAGVDIPNDKRVVVSLTYIYGIGRTVASNILKNVNISEDKRVKDLTEEELTAIRNEVDQIKVEGDLRREVSLNIKTKTKHAKFSDEITIVFVPSFKKYNKLEPIYKRVHTEQKPTKCECLIY